MTTYLGKSCSFGLPRVPFVNCGLFMYLVISLFGFEGRMWDLIIAYLFTLHIRALVGVPCGGPKKSPRTFI